MKRKKYMVAIVGKDFRPFSLPIEYAVEAYFYTKLSEAKEDQKTMQDIEKNEKVGVFKWDKAIREYVYYPSLNKKRR